MLLVVSVAFGMALAWIAPIGSDWYFHYYPALRAYLHGTSRLYDSAVLFYEPPWAVAVLLPLGLLSVESSLLVLRSLSVFLLLVLADRFTPEGKDKPLILALAALSPWTFDLVVAGTLGALVALGLAITFAAVERRNGWLWGVGMTLMMVKPQLALLPGVLALTALRAWPRERVLQAGGVLLLAGLCSVAISGWDWPLRWIRYTLSAPPYYAMLSTSYRAASELGAPQVVVSLAMVPAVGYAVWRTVRLIPSRHAMMLTAAANAVVTPYILARDFPVQMVTCWPFVARRSPRGAAVIYLLTFLPLVRWHFGHGVTWIDALFSIALLLGVAHTVRSSRPPVEPAPANAATAIGIRSAGLGDQKIPPAAS